MSRRRRRRRRATGGAALAHPRWWPSWLGVGLLGCTARLPLRLQRALGRALGLALYAATPARRRIARINLRLCFPDLDDRSRERLVRDHFRALGESVFEMAFGWWGAARRLRRLGRFRGREHLDTALARGRGVILLQGHFLATDVAGQILAAEVPLTVTYAPPKNPVMRSLTERVRGRFIRRQIHHGDVRAVLRALRANEIVWHGPDQGARERHTVTARFFGRPTATNSATARLARISGAAVVPYHPVRCADGSYELRFEPALETFPDADVIQATQRVNDVLERHVRATPAPYLWTHKRFKRDAGGDPYRWSRPPLGYRLASLALALPFAGYTAARALRDGGRRYARERLGYAPPSGEPPLWIHCASVGEIIAALPLIRELNAHGIGPLVVSTNTPTGRQVAERRAPAGVRPVYLPLDRPAPVRRFFARVRPRAAVLLETELWPWLFAAADERAIPVAIVNARLSPRTRDAAPWLRAGATFCLQRVAGVLARSDDDAEAFRALGAPVERVRTIGNLKLAAPACPPRAGVDVGRPYVLAASTHDDEEQQLARRWCNPKRRDALLAIAPRHPERGPALTEALRRMGLRVAQRSRGEAVEAETDVYLADTLGELPALIAGAELVIMGGSLIPRGGQNVLEPARAGRAIVTGPHMDNFRDETAMLEGAGALHRRPDAAAVVATATALMADPAERATMGGRAAATLEAGSDMAARYREALHEVLGTALRGGS